MDSFDEQPDDPIRPERDPGTFLLVIWVVFIPIATVTLLILMAYYAD